MCSLYQCWPERKDVDLGSIKVMKQLFISYLMLACDFQHRVVLYQTLTMFVMLQTGKYWNWYMEFLFNQGFDGLNDFIQTNTGHSSSSFSRDDRQPASQP